MLVGGLITLINLVLSLVVGLRLLAAGRAGGRLPELALGIYFLTTPVLATICLGGAYVAFDHSGKPDDARAPEYVRTILNVLHAGHEDRVLLSADFANQKYLRKSGGPGIDMIMSTTVPQLRQAGVDDRTMRKILIENPRA